MRESGIAFTERATNGKAPLAGEALKGFGDGSRRSCSIGKNYKEAQL